MEPQEPTEEDWKRLALWFCTPVCECANPSYEESDIVCGNCGGTTLHFPGNTTRFSTPYVQSPAVDLPEWLNPAENQG